jgi:hypothetical protein
MNKKIVWFSILVASLIFGLYTYWPMRAKTMTVLKETLPAIPLVAPEAVSPEATRPESPGKTLLKLVDPFSLRINVKSKITESTHPAPPSEKVIVNEPVLEGIWIDSGARVAFFYGPTHSVGENIFGWSLVSITRDSVVLEKGSATKKLKLEEK